MGRRGQAWRVSRVTPPTPTPACSETRQGPAPVSFGHRSSFFLTRSGSRRAEAEHGHSKGGMGRGLAGDQRAGEQTPDCASVGMAPS